MSNQDHRRGVFSVVGAERLSIRGFVLSKKAEEAEQLTPDGRVIHARCQKIVGINNQMNILKKYIPEENLSFEMISGRKYIVFKIGNIEKVILCASVTYLGNPHPIFKKRIQIPRAWKEFCQANSTRDVIFLGIYHYRSLDIFVDFVSDTYLKRDLHNSSAHVYTNDLYLGLTNGIHSRVDVNNNTINTVNSDQLFSYLSGNHGKKSELIEAVKAINEMFPFG